MHPDLRLEVVAPVGYTSEQVLPRVETREAWILPRWQDFEQLQPSHPAARYVSGETHLYLGRQYRLKVFQGTIEAVKLIGEFLYVWISDRSKTERIKALRERWRREQDELVFKRRLQVYLEQCPSLKRGQQPRLVNRKMTHRWGSCTKGGNVLLNLDLINASLNWMDYVIVHDLCHLQVYVHSPAFYRLLGRCLPDWEKRKRRLEACKLS